MKLLAIDGNSILNRAFYGIKLLTNKKGQFTNAIFGFMNIYLRNVEDVKPDAVAVAFDLRTPTFRHKAVSYYKANRKGMPPELAEQLPRVKELLALMGIKVVECEGYEADDVLGTLSKLCSDSGNECFVLTGDRDSLQLIDDKVTVVLATNKENIYYTPQRFTEDYGFEPIKLIDLKALMGDSSDNIPGVAGIGEKTASALIKEYGCIETLYEKYEESGLTKGVKAKLAAGAESAKESKWLATIVRDAPIDKELDSYRPSSPDSGAIGRMLTELEMFKLLDKLGINAAESTNSAPEAKADEAPAIEAEVSELTVDIIKKIKKCEYLFSGSELVVRSGDEVYETEDKGLIKAFFGSDCEKSTDDAKAHYRWAMSHGGELKNLKNDAAICGYLLNTSASDYAVDKLCAEYGVHFYSENGDLAELLSLRGLIAKLLAEIESEGMTELLEKVELPLTEVLASMEEAGVLIDKKG
ncbi:MAG: DNA polymerase I, partial [Ruminococcus sp.]|uniref:5'-3' exonuclease H3TH domain-containing protein n=1 Tax=Ruminococcus sp. TaxID=41978 RepID=UPI001AFCD453